MSSPSVVVDATSYLFPAGSMLVLLVVFVVGIGLWLWSLVDALHTNGRTWDAAGQNQLVWVVVIVLLGLLGSILYVAVAKRTLAQVSV